MHSARVSSTRDFLVGTLLGIGALLLPCQPLQAEEPKHPAKPLLWKIEGNGLESPSYLFGTIHLGGEPLATLHPAAAKAFDSADLVYTEVAMDAETQMTMSLEAVRKDGKTLTESIGPELTKQLDAELKRINPALDATPFDALKTWAIAVALPLLPSQMKGEKALDSLIWERAVAAGKHTAGIERPIDQLGIFNDLSEAEQIILLEETIRQTNEDRAAGRDSMAAMVEAYVAGDLAAIQREVDQSMQSLAESDHQDFGERLLKRVLTDRDVTMAASIDESLRQAPAKTHFFAAGAGHFGGAISIRTHLAAKGYTVTTITE